MSKRVQPLHVADAKRAMTLPESARVIDLACCLHVLMGAFREVGVQREEMMDFLEGLSKGYAEDRSVAFGTPEPRFREQLRQWSRLYLDSVEASACGKPPPGNRS